MRKVSAKKHKMIIVLRGDTLLTCSMLCSSIPKNTKIQCEKKRAFN